MENKQIMKMTLNQVSIGQSCIVVGFSDIARNKRRHLLDMGITRGCKIDVVKKAPFGDPVSIIIRGYDLCLRRKDMADIFVEVIGQ